MAHLATRRAGPSTVSATDGSRTIVLHDAQPREEGEGEGDEGHGSGANESDAGRGNSVGVLHLRGARRRGPRVAWTDDVVDNEGMGKKKSKSMCLLSSSLFYTSLSVFVQCVCSLLVRVYASLCLHHLIFSSPILRLLLIIQLTRS